MADNIRSIRSLPSVIRRAAIIAIRLPPAVMDSRIQRLPSGVQPKGDPACRSRAPEVQYHLSATLAGQQERTSSGALRHRPNSRIRDRSRIGVAGVGQVIELAGRKGGDRVVTRKGGPACSARGGLGLTRGLVGRVGNPRTDWQSVQPGVSPVSVGIPADVARKEPAARPPALPDCARRCVDNKKAAGLMPGCAD